MQIIILLVVWLTGFILSYAMERTETAAEKEPFTFGARLLIITVSLLSFLWVAVILIRAWVVQIHKTGYWSEEVNKEKDIIVVAEKANSKKRTPVNQNDN